MNKRRVVITGLGVVAANGVGVENFWQANLEGKSGARMVSGFDTSHLATHIAAQALDFDPHEYIAPNIVKRTDRFVHLGLAAAKMAVQDSLLRFDTLDMTRIGVIMGSGLGGALFHEAQMMAGYEKGVHRLNPLCVPKISPNAVVGHIGLAFGILGQTMAVSTACASGTNAVGEAYRKIQHDEMDICVSGGCEAPLTQFTFGAYEALTVLSKRNDAPAQASRPFDNDRDGFVLGEGGAVLILEELDHATQRGAPIYAEIIGYASNCGAYHVVLPQPQGLDAARAMHAAIADAGIKTSDVDYINAHGTSTTPNDAAETCAIKNVFGDHAYKLAISSTKSMIGHSIGAAGAIEALVCALALKNGIIPPTINYTNKDPLCDLDYVPNTARAQKISTVLSNSFGFGSCNACIVLSRRRL